MFHFFKDVEKETSQVNKIEEEKKNSIFLLTAKQKKRLLPLAVCFLCGVLLMAIGSMGNGGGATDEAVQAQNPTATEENNAAITSGGDSICRDVENILSKMAGVGTVSVYISYAEGERSEYAVDASTTSRTVEEMDSDGSKRITSETSESGQMVMGENKPVLIQQSKAQIQGVMVVAQGAEDLQVKAALSLAVQKLLGVPAHRIQVSPAG